METRKQVITAPKGFEIIRNLDNEGNEHISIELTLNAQIVVSVMEGIVSKKLYKTKEWK